MLTRTRRNWISVALVVGPFGLLLGGIALARSKKAQTTEPIKCQCIKAPCDCGGIPDGQK